MYLCFLARRVRTDQLRVERARVGGRQPGSSARERCSLHVDRLVDVELTQGGATRHHDLGGLSRREERQGLAAGLSSGQTAAGKLCAEGLNDFRTPAAFLDPEIFTMPYPTAIHYRHAHLTLENASPGQRGGSYSKQGCSMDARSVDGGCGRKLVF
jgi:hypothetical protein